MTKQEAYGELNLSTILIPEGYSNRPEGVNAKTHITVHETDNTTKGSDADAHARYLVGKDARKRRVSWHFTVDSDEAIKHLPTGETAWHTGTSEGNSCSIGIEMCVDGGTLKPETLERTALLCAILCNAEGIPVSNVVQHNNWSGKNCPAKLRASGGWSQFIARVEALLGELDY